jgi:site-specific DNA-methyltransferase (adenine-specific)
MWLYGSGFPKSHNISKAISKINGENVKVGKAFVVSGNLDNNIQKNLLNGKEKEGDWKHEPQTKEAQQWEGWGTALKPANEPICVARKPLSEKSVAENVLKWGTGGINIDGCRIESISNEHFRGYVKDVDTGNANVFVGKLGFQSTNSELGRFPANIILDEIAGELLDQQSGMLKGNSLNRKPRKGGHREQYVGTEDNNVKNKIISDKIFSDKGGASRFFYQAKVSKVERNMGLDHFGDKILKSNQINIEPNKPLIKEQKSIKESKKKYRQSEHYKNEILAKQQELITEYNSKQYQRDRAKEYPSIQEQLDLQYWDKINNTNKWEEAINAVKNKYPK